MAAPIPASMMKAPKPASGWRKRCANCPFLWAKGHRRPFQHHHGGCEGRNLGDCHNARDLHARALHQGKLFNIDEVLKPNKSNSKRSYDIFLGNEAGNCRCRKLPGQYAKEQSERADERKVKQWKQGWTGLRTRQPGSSM